MNAVQTSEPAGLQLVPLTPVLRALVDQAAAADGHRAVAATHAVLRGGQVVGAVALGNVPTLFLWLDRQRVGALDSYRVWRKLADHFHGAGPVCVPCTEASPLRPYLEKLGGQRIVTAHLYLKEF